MSVAKDSERHGKAAWFLMILNYPKAIIRAKNRSCLHKKCYQPDDFLHIETFAKPHESPIKNKTAVIPVPAGIHLKISETYFIQ
ncbi:hypothetical protein [Neisseria weixii]|uniref:hypothetical protein n=1 Tax=Neisseria weixii TaxID=1853276 RepID=UPI0035A0D02A